MTALVFVDVETTGLDPARHQVWETAYAVDDGPILSSLVRHTNDGADEEALKVGRYWDRVTSGDFDNGDAFWFEVDLRTALAGATLVGANPAFDAAFLRHRWDAAPWHYRLLDVEAYAMPALKLDRPRGLAYIAEQLEVAAPDHSAAEDVRALRECFTKLRDIYRTGTL